MVSRYVLAMGLAWALTGSTVAMPLIVITEQERTVSGSAFADDGFDSDSDAKNDAATDLAPFNAAASAQVYLSGALGAGGAIQNSAFREAGMSVSGSTFSNAEGYEFESFADGDGDTLFRATFQVMQAAQYNLQGSIAAYDGGFADLTLTDGVGAVIEAFSAGGGEQPVNAAGALAPGTYTLRLDAGGSSYGDFYTYGYASTEFDVDLGVLVPGPGGEVDDLSVRRLGGDTVELTWSPSCRNLDVDYAVYAGPSPGALQPVACSTTAAALWSFTPIDPVTYILVVPHDGNTEGSYGRSSSGERTPSATACMLQALGLPVCP